MAHSWMKKTVAASVVALGLVAAVPAAANAGIYTWKYAGTYASPEACHDAGKQQSGPGGDADTYKCVGESGADLYLGYIW